MKTVESGVLAHILREEVVVMATKAEPLRQLGMNDMIDPHLKTLGLWAGIHGIDLLCQVLIGANGQWPVKVTKGQEIGSVSHQAFKNNHHGALNLNTGPLIRITLMVG